MGKVESINAIHFYMHDNVDEIFDETQKEATETKMLPKGEEDIDNQLNI